MCRLALNMNLKLPSLTEVITCLYEAGADPRHWPEAAIQIGRYAQSCTTNLMWVERSGRRVIWYTDGLLKETQAIYTSRLYNRDPAYQFALSAELDRPGIIENVDPGQDEALLELQEILSKNGIVSRARTVALRTPRHLAFIGLGRRQEKKPFDLDALRYVREVSPHFRRAIQVAYRLRTTEQLAYPIQEILDRFTYGVFLVDRSLRVAYMNAEGSRMLRELGALNLRRRILTAASPKESLALEKLLDGAIKTALGQGSDIGGWLTLHDTLGAPILYLDVTPLRISNIASDGASQSPRAMIVARRPESSLTLLPETLREHFRLSPAEARLAIALAQGDSLKEIAEQRGVTFGTVRAQLASIFDKTGVHRQSELVKLLLGISGDLSVKPRTDAFRTTLRSVY